MSFGTKVGFEAVREIAFGGISGTYAVVGGILTDFTRIIAFNNSTDAEVYISFDGTNDHLRIAVGGFKLLDFTANSVHDNGYFLAQRTQVYVKQVSGAPTSGAVWVEVVFGEGGK